MAVKKKKLNFAENLKRMKRYFFFLLFATLSLVVEAKVELPQLFQSGMVLQRGKVIPVWGKASGSMLRWLTHRAAGVLTCLR